MLFKDNRTAEIIRTLIKYPMTTEMLKRSSANFERPFAHLNQVNETLKTLVDEGYLNRQVIPTISTGNKPYLYYLKARAARIAPELADMKRKNSLFRGLCSTPWHTLAISEIMSHFERSLGAIRKRARLLASLRDGHFRARVTVSTVQKTESVALVPDYTHVVEIDGKPNLLFFEVQNEGGVITPIDPHSITRSFKFKLAKYKAFQQEFKGHHLIRHFEKVFQCQFRGFRVLIVTTRSEANKRNLLETARGHKKLFYFSTLDEITRNNMFTDPVWELPNDTRRGLLDF